LIYLALPSAKMSRLRVAERVAHGGHNIPKNDIIRRFPRSLHNLLYVFAPEVDRVQCYMNGGTVPELVFLQEYDVRTIFHPDFYKLLLQKAQP
jgi:predicted ABC-type ATPase